MNNNQIHVRIEDLCKTYQTQRAEIEAIRQVQMEVHRSEFISILGPSGCGKSTLLMAVGGLLPITSGSIKVDDTPVTRPRRDTGVVFQSPVLMPWRTITKNVLFPIECLGLSVRDYATRAEELLEMTGLAGDVGVEGYLDQDVAQLLGQHPGIAPVDRFQDLVGLLQQVALQRLVGLFPIPRATARGS